MLLGHEFNAPFSFFLCFFYFGNSNHLCQLNFEVVVVRLKFKSLTTLGINLNIMETTCTVIISVYCLFDGLVNLNQCRSCRNQEAFGQACCAKA